MNFKIGDVIRYVTIYKQEEDIGKVLDKGVIFVTIKKLDGTLVVVMPNHIKEVYTKDKNPEYFL